MYLKSEPEGFDSKNILIQNYGKSSYDYYAPLIVFVYDTASYSGIFPGWIFSLRDITFFTLMADYDQFLHVSAAFNWLHRAIMPVGRGKSKFWTRHLR